MEYSKTYSAIPPGESIKEQLQIQNMTQREFAKRMNLSEKHISQLLNGKVQLTNETALKLQSVLGVPDHFWNNLELRYREKLAKVKEENEMDSDKELVKFFPYKEMVENKWIKNTKSTSEKVRNLRAFFQVANLDCLNNLDICYRKLKETNGYSQLVWNQQARLSAKKIIVSKINIDNLKNNLPEIRAMTTKSPSEFLPILEELLSNCGIALVILPHLKGTYLHGASFIDGDHLVIGLTLRRKDADIFWFSFFHEIGHILNGDLTNTENSKENELKIDQFAANILIPEDKYREFVAESSYSKEAIKTFASNISIQPGIVVGRLQKDEFLPYNYCNDLKKQYIFSN